MNLGGLATRAVRAAARIRAEHGIGPADATCPFDLAEQLGVVVRMVGLPSVEGVFLSCPRPIIFVSIERPPGRRRYTCAHELAHHVFGHGTCLDEIGRNAEATWNPEEFLAQRFAAALLMPKLAIESSFARRGWSIETPSPESVFVVAQNLGVGYATLLEMLERTLERLSAALAVKLRRIPLSRIRSGLAGFVVDRDLVVVDEHWGTRPVDIEIGDTVLLPDTAAFEGCCAILRPNPAPHLQATAAGSGSIALGRDRRPIAIRVSRRGFTGLARYRHLEEFGV